MARGCPYCQRPGCRRSRPLCPTRRGAKARSVAPRGIRIDVKPSRVTCYCGRDRIHPHRVASLIECEKHPNHAAGMWAEIERKIQ
jgi:hypothetical protein